MLSQILLVNLLLVITSFLDLMEDLLGIRRASSKESPI